MTRLNNVSTLPLVGVIIFVRCNVRLLTPVRTEQYGSRSNLINLIKKITNLPDGVQVEVFYTIASFPAISFPVLEMISNELARVFESSRGVPLGEPGPSLEQGGGWGVTIQAKGKK